MSELKDNFLGIPRLRSGITYPPCTGGMIAIVSPSFNG
jgi:hypothetical protein